MDNIEEMKMEEFVVSGVLKEITIEKGSPLLYRLRFVPDAECVTTLRRGNDTHKCVVLQPTSKWVCGYVFQFDNMLSLRIKTNIASLMSVGGHYELTVVSKISDSLFDFAVDDAPSSIGLMSVIKIKSV